MAKKISVANLVMLGGALVTLLFSFFSFYEIPYGDSYNAWSRDIGAFVTTIPALLALAMLGWGIAEVVGANLPHEVLTFNSNQLKATWGISAAGIMLAFLTQDSGADKGIGFWLMFLGSAAMCAGAVMALLGKGANMVNLGGGGAVAPPPAPGAPPPPPPPPPPPAP